MGRPAARRGDLTAHGGVVVAGCPTVLIGGMPAARVNDMHVCPMCNPGSPPPPHIGGPIVMGSNTVVIGGQPAARVGSMCVCSGPPDSIAMGCDTVSIGDSGGSGSGRKSKAGKVHAELGPPPTELEESHFLDVAFVDSAGLPISGTQYAIKGPEDFASDGALMEKVKKTGIPPGDYDIRLKGITKAAWSKPEARDGETVKMLVETVGIEDGAAVTFEVWERAMNRADRMNEATNDTTVMSGGVQSEWQYSWADKETKVSSDEEESIGCSPMYYFIVRIDGCSARSNLLECTDFVELYVRDDNEEPLSREPFRVILCTGEVRSGKLDDNGYARMENVPPGKWGVDFPRFGWTGDHPDKNGSV
jgi:uncharacterized Zn-binding protein involved in type VI secretion